MQVADFLMRSTERTTAVQVVFRGLSDLLVYVNSSAAFHLVVCLNGHGRFLFFIGLLPSTNTRKFTVRLLDGAWWPTKRGVLVNDQYLSPPLKYLLM